MKMQISRNWNFIGVIRLVVGAAGTVQGFVIKEFALSLAGFFLVYMAVAAAGYFGADKTEVKLEEATVTVKENEHEKMDTRL